MMLSLGNIAYLLMAVTGFLIFIFVVASIHIYVNWPEENGAAPKFKIQRASLKIHGDKLQHTTD